MAKHIVFNDINTLMEMIREQSQIIQNYDGKIPQIELDIIMTNLQRLYEDFYELKKLNQQYKPEPVIDEEQIPVFETEERELVTIITDPAPAAEVHPEKMPDPEPEIKEERFTETVVKEDVKTEVAPVITEKSPVTELKKQELQKKPVKKASTADLFAEAENVTLADKFKADKKTFHDTIVHENKDKTLAETLLKPISDLRTGIGVNDRFVFINELFGGSMNDYQIAIEEINKQTDFARAENVLTELKAALGWNDTESYHKLLSFVRRRFL